MNVRVNRNLTVGFRSFERGDVADIPEDRAGPLLAAGHVSVHQEISAPPGASATGPKLPELTRPTPAEVGPAGFPELAPSPRPPFEIEAETPTPADGLPADTAARILPELNAAPVAPPELHVVVDAVKSEGDAEGIVGPNGNVIVPAAKLKRNRP